ncbi:MAG: hypothetical protein E6Q40_03180, partial [Cupriavidus sp.]
YYLITALWPLVHMRSFLAVTGPKTDLWLVRTVGALILAISLPLIAAFATERTDSPIILLAAGSCIALATVDIVYVAKKVISPIYLGDAVIEIALLIGLGVIHYSAA